MSASSNGRCAYCGAPDNGTCAYPSEGKPGCFQRKGSQQAYKITREQCQEHIFGVCSGCGGKLEPLETVDNARNPTFWPGCMSCSQFDHGVSEQVFRIAKQLVEQHRLRPYSFIDENEPGWLVAQTRGATSIVLDVLHAAKEFGLVLQQQGAEK